MTTRNVLGIGQSNMNGRAIATPFPMRATDNIFMWNDAWLLAMEPVSYYYNNGGANGTATCSPMLAFANDLNNIYPGQRVNLIPAAWGSTGLVAGNITLWSQRGAGTIYQISLDRCNAAGVSPDIILWFQGETDSDVAVSQVDYYNALEQLISDYRTYFSKPNLPFIITQLGGYGTAAVEAAQLQADDGHHTMTITGIGTGTLGGGVHFDTPQLEMIAQKWADIYYQREVYQGGSVPIIAIPYQKVTVPNALVGVSEAHYTRRINLARMSSILWSKVITRGNITVYDSTGTELPCIVKNLNIGSKSGYIDVDCAISTITNNDVYISTGVSGKSDNANAVKNSSKYMRFTYDESSGAPGDDCGNFSGNALTGATQGNSGLWGSSVYFTGATDHHLIPSVSQLQSAVKFKISILLKFTQLNGTWQMLWQTDNSTASGLYASLYLEFFPDTGFVNDGHINFTTFFDTVNWHLFQTYYDGSLPAANRVSWGFDGLETGGNMSGTVPTSLANLANALTIGGSNGGGGIINFPAKAYFDEFYMSSDFTVGGSITEYNNKLNEASFNIWGSVIGVNRKSSHINTFMGMGIH